MTKIIYNNHTGKKGIDLSVHNFAPGKPVNLQQFQGVTDFAIPRASFGQVKDARYDELSAQIQQHGFDLAIYHYLDYYSHTSLGLNSTNWGIRQGQFNNSINPGKARVFIDIENSSKQAPVTERWGTVVTILDNILFQIDNHTGLTTGIYASLGLLDRFYGYHKHRPLWVAWYSDKTLEQVLEAVTKKGWTNPFAWQNNSNGDITGNGKGDGLSLGLSYANFDTNYFLRSTTEYEQFFKKPTTPEIPGTPLTDTEKLSRLWEAHPELH